MQPIVRDYGKTVVGNAANSPWTGSYDNRVPLPTTRCYNEPILEPIEREYGIRGKDRSPDGQCAGSKGRKKAKRK